MGLFGVVFSIAVALILIGLYRMALIKGHLAVPMDWDDSKARILSGFRPAGG